MTRLSMFLVAAIGLAACNRAALDSADATPGAGVDAAGGPCSASDEDTCVQRTDCHGLYNVQACRNILGYCAQFERCADGPGDCTGPGGCAVDEPFCAGPYVVSYDLPCPTRCVRADQCGGCQPAKFAFAQDDGCQNDGSLEFCIPPGLETAVKTIAPTLSCAPGGGRAMCDPATQLLCFFPTSDAAVCTTPLGGLTDAAYAMLCQLSTLPQITEIVRTILE